MFHTRSRGVRHARTIFLFTVAAVALGCDSDDNGPSGPGGDAPKAVLTHTTTEVRRGQRLSLSLRNTGAIPLRYRECVVAAERLQGGRWLTVTLPAEWANCDEPARTLAPGATATATPVVPQSLTPALYQVAIYITSTNAPEDAPPVIKYSSTFSILP